jgi:type VI secretion system secreted protein Hcp
MAPPLNTSTHASADAFLSMSGKRQGAIKGECKSTGHVDEITVVGWQWGVSAPTAVGSGQATGRRVYEALVITKHIDAASTKLMAALTTNEEIKSAKLSLRKAGLAADDFMTIELGQARVTGLHIDFTDDGSTREILKITYQKIEVNYHPQLTGGGKAGSMSFTDDIGPQS